MTSLPIPFIKRMQAQLGQEFEDFQASLDTIPPVSIRLNPNKNGQVPNQELYDGQIPWCSDAYYLKKRPTFILDPHLHGGSYYVQEASSMFLQTVLRQLQADGFTPTRALDLCAAPGGKSTLIASFLPATSLLVANEVIKTRAAILKENLIKWGQDNVVITNSDPSRFSTLSGAFDLILVDAPCSGEGMFRKDEKAIEEWSENNLRLCEERQKRILTDIWPALRPNGFLIYSTCTYNQLENDGILAWLMDKFNATPISIQQDFPGITRTRHGVQFYPHKTRGEGLFMGIVQKNDGEDLRLKKEKQNTPRIKLSESTKQLLPDLSGYTTYCTSKTLGIIPTQHAGFIQLLDNMANIIYKGCEIGEEIKGMLKPSPALALYSKLRQDQTQQMPLDLPNALQYLRREDLHGEIPAGDWLLLTYQNTTLGWGKKVGDRLNNYYPKEWRIRNA